jgi:hypothetical protein
MTFDEKVRLLSELVRVRQLVTVKATGQVRESSVTHTYTFEDGLVASMVVS